MTRPAHRPPRGDVSASARITLRVTPALKAQVQAEAERAGLTVTDYLIAAHELALARGDAMTDRKELEAAALDESRLLEQEIPHALEGPPGRQLTWWSIAIDTNLDRVRITAYDPRYSREVIRLVSVRAVYAARDPMIPVRGMVRDAVLELASARGTYASRVVGNAGAGPGARIGEAPVRVMTPIERVNR